jgi:CRISPR/Cas system-associated exonuclease Cas4 (RecB family)
MSHATLSPSKRVRWSACPGSVREERAYPEQPSGPSAIDGTHSHTLLEHCIKAGCADPTTMVGVKMKDHDGEFTIDGDRAARVKIAIDYIARRGENAVVAAEMRVDPQWLTSRTDLDGTVDVQIHNLGERWLEIIDYKDGMNDAWDSALLQMEQYAVGVLSQFQATSSDQYPFDKVILTVIQPKLALKGGQAIRSVEYSIARVLDEVVEAIVAQARVTDAPDAPLVPGDKQCRYCAHRGACSALATQALQVVDRVDLSVSAADKDPTTMTDEQIVQIMEAAPLMRQLLDGVEKEAQRRLESGVPMPGLKLVNGRTSRSWRLSEDEMAEKLVKLGIPKGAIYETRLVSPAKAEKLTWKKRDGTEVQLSKRQLDLLDKEYVAKTLGKPVVALASDSRPAVQMNAAPLFGAVEKPVDTLPAWLM